MNGGKCVSGRKSSAAGGEVFVCAVLHNSLPVLVVLLLMAGNPCIRV